VLGAASSCQALELGAGDDSPERSAGRVRESQVEGPAGRSLEPAGAQPVQLLEQLAEVRRGDRLPVHLRRFGTAASGRSREVGDGAAVVPGSTSFQGAQWGNDRQVGGDRWPAGVPGAGDQVEQHPDPQLPDAVRVAGGLGQPRVGVEGVRDRGGHRLGQEHPQLGHPVPHRAHGDVGRPCGLFAAAVGGGLVQAQQLLADRGPQPPDRQRGGPRQHRRLHRREHRRLHLSSGFGQLGGDRAGPWPVQLAVSQRCPRPRQPAGEQQ
jgi:hypothetical protein